MLIPPSKICCERRREADAKEREFGGQSQRVSQLRALGSLTVLAVIVLPVTTVPVAPKTTMAPSVASNIWCSEEGDKRREEHDVESDRRTDSVARDERVHAGHRDSVGDDIDRAAGSDNVVGDCRVDAVALAETSEKG